MARRPTEKRFDAVVIGCGPAGAVTAAELAAAGLEVACIDGGPGRHGGGEALSATGVDVLRLLGLEPLLSGPGFRPRSSLRLVGRDGRPEVRIPLRAGHHVVRSAFDAMLLGHARRRGVHHRLGTVTEVRIEEGRPIGVSWRSKDGPERRATCEVLVDASGASAVLSRQGVAGGRRITGSERLVTLRLRMASTDASHQDESLLLHGDPLHYAWIVPVSPLESDVCLVVPEATWRRGGRRAEALLAEAEHAVHPALHEYVHAGRRVGAVEVLEHQSFRIRPFVGARWLCVGEALGAVEPIFGFGLGMSMAQGVHAARAAAARVRGGDETAIAEYARFAERGLSAAADVVGYFGRFPAFFASRANEEGFPALLSGDMLGEAEPTALGALRSTLRSANSPRAPGPGAREIARRVRARYFDQPAVCAAFLEVTEDGTLVSLVLDEDAPADDTLHELEESLYQEFGRDHLAVVRWYGAGGPGLRTPHFDREHVIFDRRTS